MRQYLERKVVSMEVISARKRDIFDEEDKELFTEEEMNEVRMKANDVATSIVADMFPNHETNSFERKRGERELEKLLKEL